LESKLLGDEAGVRAVDEILIEGISAIGLAWLFENSPPVEVMAPKNPMA
jgi:hypothetical protein